MADLGAGLDTSNGLEFVQRRLALFARSITLINLGFLAAAVIVGLLVGGRVVFGRPQIAQLVGFAVLVPVWLLGRRTVLSQATLGAVDAAALVGACTAWAFFIEPPMAESIHGAVVSVSITVLVRAIMVPTQPGRTLRQSALAVLPVTAMMWLSRDAFVVPDIAAAAGSAVTVTVFFQTVLLTAVVWMATVTSATLYQLRRSVREANELGQYALEEKLGQGGMGEVWRGRHRLLIRPAAIKLIRPDLLTGAQVDPGSVLRRFEREARATAALRSPHTVELYDFGQAEDGTLFYVMELLSGIDLEHLVSRFGPVPAERAVHLLKQVCHALEEAHQNGLTHRDIKPANIVVSQTGSELDFVKVLDFGLVGLRSGQSGDRGRLTAEPGVGVTPAYVAPEVARGDASYDHRVDIYAVGCVAYWLVTGKLVFESNTTMGLLFHHASTPAKRPTSRTELPIPPDFEDLVMECLEKEASRRPATAAELARRLSACTVGDEWTRDRAEEWWRTHAPSPEPDRPLADVLLSREQIPGVVRALRPRRPAAER